MSAIKRSCGVVIALTVAMLGATAVAQSALAGDRPVNVAFVKAHPLVDLKPNGSVVVTAKIACKPGWESSDLSVHVSQANGAYADGFTTTSIACNGKWHNVRLTLSSGFKKMHRGAATISSQFLVTNVQSGDSAGAHDVTKGWIRPVCARAT